MGYWYVRIVGIDPTSHLFRRLNLSDVDPDEDGYDDDDVNVSLHSVKFPLALLLFQCWILLWMLDLSFLSVYTTWNISAQHLRQYDDINSIVAKLLQ